MIAYRNYRERARSAQAVNLRLSLVEFREHVEWLEGLAYGDGATTSWREELDRIDPPQENLEDELRPDVIEALRGHRPYGIDLDV